MTPRQLRTQRRAAERRDQKLARRMGNQNDSQQQAAVPAPPTRADVNCINGLDEAAVLSELKTQKNASTGPRTPEGKLASSRNSFKHGLASAQLIIPGEDPAAFDALLTDLLAEHQPANSTEQLLVQEMAQSYWLTQRAIRFQNQCFAPEGVDEKRLALFLRYQTTHERAFHKALNTLIRLKKDRARGFVSQELADSHPEIGFVSQKATSAEPSSSLEIEFVSQNDPESLAEAA
jgi:hypothetical protein